jgi:hypothetical protein
MGRSRQRERYFQTTGAQYMAQARAAADWERAHHEQLLAAGWVYDETLRQYTHPDDPSTVIAIG